jgi:hypothetical protein
MKGDDRFEGIVARWVDLKSDRSRWSRKSANSRSRPGDRCLIGTSEGRSGIKRADLISWQFGRERASSEIS